ncbi:hypothetical protein [Saccharothrix sp. ST-888]|uniref:hypothetical protein n=1 Tax=Saccharothrix sp. ST-888 TaxID=1427391 RepID=UPI0005EC6488|nr:hypothetical protein [Saccharothrix sp. ST-888]KJK56109.1 hypothetical protein UK12_24525 [Saccharothrix sp. ST-888]
MSYLDRVKELIADRDAARDKLRDANGDVPYGSQHDWDKTTTDFEYEVGQVIDYLVDEIEQAEDPNAGKWTLIVDLYGGSDPVVIHAVGDTVSAARRDASLKAFKEHGIFLNVRDGEVHPAVGECDEEGSVAVIFPGHISAVRD